MKKFRRRAYTKAIQSESRPAETGEKIIIVKPHHTESEYGYKIGDIFTVGDIFSESVHTTDGLALWNYEYRVIHNAKEKGKSGIDKLLDRGIIKLLDEPRGEKHPYYSRAYNVSKEDFKK